MSNTSDDDYDSDVIDDDDENYLTEYVLPMTISDAVVAGPSTETFPEKTEADIGEKAEQFLSGSLSYNEYEAIVKEKSASRGIRRLLPAALVSLVGEANMCFARRDYEGTLRMCKELIRNAPDISEPYRTLSELYEEHGDHERSLSLGMLAAALDPKDAERWMELGAKAVELEKLDKAAICYSHAARADPSMIDAHLKKIQIFEQLDDRKSVIASYKTLVNVTTGEAALEYAKTCAQMLHEDNDLKGALVVMETAFQKSEAFVGMTDVNLLVELYISLQQYQDALKIIAKHCDVEIEADEDLVSDPVTEELIPSSLRILTCKINKEMPLQIRTKLILVLIHLQAFHLLDEMIAPLQLAIDEYGDLLIDVVEAYMTYSKHTEALKLLKLLVARKSMNVPQVWLHYADCLRHVGRKEEAANAYLVVMEMAPHLTDARLMVSQLLNDLGRGEEALTALTQDPDADYLDVSLLFEKALLLKDNPLRKDEFLAVGRLLMSRHCSRIRTRKELNTLTRYTGCSRRQEALRRMREDDAQPMDEPMYLEGKRMPTPDEDWALFRALCDAAFSSQNFTLLQRLTFCALGSKVLCRDLTREKEIYALATLSCFFNRDTYFGHTFLRQILISEPNNSRAWNLFNLVAIFSEETRQQRFVMRMLRRIPSHPALPMIFANNCFMSGSYRQAVSEYLLQFKHDPSPLLALMIASTFTLLSCQKQSASTNALVTQAMGFIAQYRDMRGEGSLQEIHYNMGRLNHQLGLLHVALYHYKQALELEAPCALYDLKKEAAYNISIIYFSAKSFGLARYYLNKYIVV